MPGGKGVSSHVVTVLVNVGHAEVAAAVDGSRETLDGMSDLDWVFARIAPRKPVTVRVRPSGTGYWRVRITNRTAHPVEVVTKFHGDPDTLHDVLEPGEQKMLKRDAAATITVSTD